MAQEKSDGPQEDEANLVSTIGPVEIDWPRTVGFYGGLVVAVATEMIAPPLALFVAAYPLLKMLNRPGAPLPVQIVSQVLEGAAKPINGDAEGTIRIKSSGKTSAPKPAKAQPKALPAPRSTAPKNASARTRARIKTPVKTRAKSVAAS